MALNPSSLRALVALVAIFAAPAWADDDAPEVYQQGGIVYVTGGIGRDESEALRATESRYNLRVMNADRAGRFSGNTRITISDMQHTVLLDALGGPLFYANLPKGRYLVEGFAYEQTRKQVVTVSSQKTARVRFVWPEDISDTPNY